MPRLSIFDRSNDTVCIEERPLTSGRMVIGRGADADWVLDDPNRLLSRHHCALEIANDTLVLTDLSTNGVFVGSADSRRRLEKSVVLKAGQEAFLGSYVLRIANDVAEVTDQAGLLAAAGAAALGQDDLSDLTLFEAFCSGARLDVSLFANEDPVLVMHRAGGIYREMVAGLSELMTERTSTKAEFVLEQTCVQAVGNNLFRWGNPSRLSVDLLRDGPDGFMVGKAAVKSSFVDIKSHLRSVVRGMKAAVLATLEQVSPRSVERRLQNRQQMIGYKAAAWTEYVNLHAQIVGGDQYALPGTATQAFRKAYAAGMMDGPLGGPDADLSPDAEELPPVARFFANDRSG